MKRSAFISVLSAILVMVMVFALAGCNSSDDKTAETKATTATQAQTEKATEAATQAQTEKATEAPTENTAEQQNSNDDPVMPTITGTWKHENYPSNYSVTVNVQSGNTIEFTVTAIKGNASQIATSDITVTLDTYDDGTLIRGEADFEYVDSFGCGGTGSISASENVITLVINQEYNDGGRWSIANATGDYIFAHE